MLAALKIVPLARWGMLIRDHLGNGIYAATKFEMSESLPR